MDTLENRILSHEGKVGFAIDSIKAEKYRFEHPNLRSDGQYLIQWHNYLQHDYPLEEITKKTVTKVNQVDKVVKVHIANGGCRGVTIASTIVGSLYMASGIFGAIQLAPEHGTNGIMTALISSAITAGMYYCLGIGFWIGNRKRTRAIAELVYENNPEAWQKAVQTVKQDYSESVKCLV